ncbi:MAG: hypothetical protein ACOVS5_06615 [Oligoflexus sp.]
MIRPLNDFLARDKRLFLADSHTTWSNGRPSFAPSRLNHHLKLSIPSRDLAWSDLAAMGRCIKVLVLLVDLGFWNLMRRASGPS